MSWKSHDDNPTKIPCRDADIAIWSSVATCIASDSLYYPLVKTQNIEMGTESIVALTLYPATHEQKIESRKRTCLQWGRGLTEEEYLTRDAKLDVLEHAADGKMTTWVLVPRDNPTTLDFKCACETYRRRGLVKTPETKEADEVFGYGIASVYTPPQNRGKGYARHMMSLLHWVLAPRAYLPQFPEKWGSPPPEVAGCGNARFSALYSDIGPEFYKSCGPDGESPGWVVREPAGTVWQVPEDVTTVEFPDSSLPVEWLDEEGCKAIWEQDVKLMREDMKKTTSTRTLFTFLPHEGTGPFLQRRAVFFLYNQQRPISPKWGVISHPNGAELSEKDHSPTFATWTLEVDPGATTLVLTRLRATKETFPQLLANVLLAARECDMDRVEVWNLPKELEDVAHSLKGKTEERDEHLNAFKWYGTESSDDVEWLYNEKFCWC